MARRGSRNEGRTIPQEQMEKAKEAIQFLSTIGVGESSDEAASGSIPMEESGNGKIFFLCVCVCVC